MHERQQMLFSCTTNYSRITARGFTLFELLIVVSIMAVLGGAMISHTYNAEQNGKPGENAGVGYQAKAERAQVSSVVGALRSALHLRVAKLFVAGKQRQISNLVSENPMTWLAEVPHNYLGEFFSPKITELSVESWYYDKSDKKLVYLLNYGRDYDHPEANVLRYKIRLLTSSTDGGVDGVVLEQVK
jgi:prepilin-type N-terminal cleavage/methylation domain-containing protein